MEELHLEHLAHAADDDDDSHDMPHETATSSPHTLKSAVFFNAQHTGHFNPTKELVKILVEAGITVHYFATIDLKSAIEALGAIFHNYGSDDWTLQACAMEGVSALGCEPSQGLREQRLFHQCMAATWQLLPFLLEKLEKIAPNVCISDSGYPWGHVAARILGIPSISSCSSFMMSHAQREAVFANLRELDFNQKARALLRERYGVEYDPADSYCNYSEFTIVWCNSKFLTQKEGDAKDPRCHFFGASRPMPMSDFEQVISDAVARLGREPKTESHGKALWRNATSSIFPLAELKRKGEAGERIFFVSMGTVVGSAAWAKGMIGSFYKQVFDAFGGEDKTTVVVSIGRGQSLEALPPVPANYIVRNSVPQNAFLRISTLFFTHCGMNSTNEAMFAGVPMVCMPCFGDQNFNASRVEQLGMGVHIQSPFAPGPAQNLEHLTAVAMRGAADQILSDYARFKECCGKMTNEMLAQCRYLHTGALSDMSAWVEQERVRLGRDTATIAPKPQPGAGNSPVKKIQAWCRDPSSVPDAFDAFMAIDTSGNGFISAAEFRYLMTNDGNILPDDEVDALIRDGDVSGDGQINYEEWVKTRAGVGNSPVKKIQAWCRNPASVSDAFNAFVAIDRSGNGFISAAEFRYLMTSEGDVLTDDEVDVLIREGDIDGSGRINYDEWVKSVKMKGYFQQYDVDGNGSISKDEFRTVFSDFNDEEFETLYKKADTNGDGVISYEEFVDWLLRGGGKS